jgi:cation:H+ antiporter
LINIFLFILAYIIIFYLADYLIDLLEDFIESFTISPIVVGILILGIDLEESIVSVLASVNNLPYLAIGNLIGNTIVAIVIAFGIPVFFLKFEYKQIPIFFYASMFLASITVLLSTIFPDFLIFFALLNLVIFLAYLGRSILFHLDYRKKNLGNEKIEEDKENDEETGNKNILILKVVLVIAIIFICGDILVLTADGIIGLTGLTETFFGLVVMAFVTNVEEFWLIVNAIRKGQTELGISAQIGKILWNTTLIFSICGIILIQYTYDIIMVYSSLILIIIVSVLIYNLLRKNLSKSSGVIYILILLGFLVMNSIYIL